MRVTGKIVRGLEESGTFLSIAWVSREISAAFGFQPFPGTLNIAVDDANIQKALKEKATQRLVAQQEGFCDAYVFKAVISGTYECGIIIPLVENYSSTLLEIVAPVKLKDALGLDDGDEVTVDIAV